MWGKTGDSVAESRVPESIPSPRISSCLVPSYLPSSTSSPLTPRHHPTALCTPPQKSSDSWKVLGVYSVTTKQNHLKTKWAGECATAIRPYFLCGRREKRPLRIMGSEGGQGDAHHFNPQVILHILHTPTLLSAAFKGEHAIWNRAVCVTVPPWTRYSLSLFLSLISFSLLSHFHLPFPHLISQAMAYTCWMRIRWYQNMECVNLTDIKWVSLTTKYHNNEEINDES